MMDVKTGISLVAVGLIFVAYAPYIKDTILGKTTPHVFTWLIWGSVTAIVYALQVSAGAGAGSWVTLGVVLMSFFIFILGLRNGKKDITMSDTIFLLLAIVAVILWLFAKQPVLSVVLVSSIDMLGFAPTIRKSWSKPYSETLFLYELNSVRHALSIIALQNYNIITMLYPVSWTLANLTFSLILIVRRKQIEK